jgi:hypothetical protein
MTSPMQASRILVIDGKMKEMLKELLLKEIANEKEDKSNSNRRLSI